MKNRELYIVTDGARKYLGRYYDSMEALGGQPGFELAKRAVSENQLRSVGGPLTDKEAEGYFTSNYNTIRGMPV